MSPVQKVLLLSAKPYEVVLFGMTKLFKVSCQYCALVGDTLIHDGFIGRFQDRKQALSVKRKHKYYYGAGHNADITTEWID